MNVGTGTPRSVAKDMYLNGSPATAEDLLTLALYNYGCFTSMVVDQGRVRGLELHLARLRRDSLALFDTEIDTAFVRACVREALDGSGVEQPVVVRVTLFQRDFEMGRPTNRSAPDVLVTFRPAPRSPAAPMRVATTCYERDEPLLKGTALLGQLRLRRVAQSRGFDDVLFLDASGHITEGATWNVGFVRDREVIWPEGSVLPGTAMALLQQTLADRGFKVGTRPVSRSEIPEFPFAFASNAVVGVRAINGIDDIGLPADRALEDELRACWLSIPFEEV